MRNLSNTVGSEGRGDNIIVSSNLSSLASKLSSSASASSSVNVSPSFARRCRALKEADDTATQLRVVNCFPLSKYVAIADKLFTYFEEAFESVHLDDAYVYGMQFAELAITNLPKHKDWASTTTAAGIAEEKLKSQIVKVLSRLEIIKRRMDEEELMKLRTGMLAQAEEEVRTQNQFNRERKERELRDTLIPAVIGEVYQFPIPQQIDTTITPHTEENQLSDDTVHNCSTVHISNVSNPVAVGVPVLKNRDVSTGAPPTTNYNTHNNNSNNEKLASHKTWNDYFREMFQKDGRLLIITIAILLCMNIPIIKWILYPFTIFSTWIHELCHGLSAIVVGGSISKIMIYPDTSGLAYTSLRTATPNRRGFIASAGYQGTAVIGCLLLLFRRTKRGPRTGTMTIALLMIISCCAWIRNVFGFAFIFCFGVILMGIAWKLPSRYMRDVYIVLAVTCALNAITNIHDLFGANYRINGNIDSTCTTDAHTMSDVMGGSYLFWAMLWLSLAIILTVVGFIFAIPGPDEVADFRCCGMCQDTGCFKFCNYPGQRV